MVASLLLLAFSALASVPLAVSQPAARLPSLKMRRSAGRSSDCLILADFFHRSGLLAVCRLIFIDQPMAEAEADRSRHA